MKLTWASPLDRILAMASIAPNREIVYAMKTCWWGWYAGIPYRMPGTDIPCDPRGSGLMIAKIGDFLNAAKENAAFYGRHGLHALAAAWHGNVTTDDGRPTSFEGWDGYNELIDRFGLPPEIEKPPEKGSGGGS